MTSSGMDSDNWFRLQQQAEIALSIVATELPTQSTNVRQVSESPEYRHKNAHTLLKDNHDNSIWSLHDFCEELKGQYVKCLNTL